MASALFDEHAVILTAVDEIIRAAERKPRIRLDELSRMRVRISHLIKLHRQEEEQHIITPYRTTEAAEMLPHIKPVLDGIRLNWMHYSEHVRVWTPRAIEADWDGYVAALHSGGDAIRKMMAHEEEAVYHPVLDQIAGQSAAARTRTYSVGGVGSVSGLGSIGSAGLSPR